MTPVQMLFSFEGRLRRRDFWLCVLGLIVAQWVLQAIIGVAFVPTMLVTPREGPVWWMASSQMTASFMIIGLILLWPRLAIGTKRLHDRGKTGWWLLLMLIPVIGWIWLVIDLGFLDGTPGPNTYGPSPKGLEETAQA